MKQPPQVDLDAETIDLIMANFDERPTLKSYGFFLTNPSGNIYDIVRYQSSIENGITSGFLEYLFMKEFNELQLKYVANNHEHHRGLARYLDQESRAKGRKNLYNAFNLMVNLWWDELKSITMRTWVLPARCAKSEDSFSALNGWEPFDPEQHLGAVRKIRDMGGQKADYREVQETMVEYFKELK